ncbi:MAG: zinc ABC transporter substrate-binding protein [Hamadaea sp.]|uniref:metal ABC transporter substrate-binding protein n=1 Tax=Hamadaea sp. TaxID=2024425 RepID=UPI00180024B5|nr:metal ABC transporter substrate-binding protein [Hamadaea sp.]NUR73921.1 zinc ABC transporter substrate-binding protein [Hamadaea sp.]NUT19604.1 zinc ABC transporter substrate-binding protein [Hamadaea sp.]
MVISRLRRVLTIPTLVLLATGTTLAACRESGDTGSSSGLRIVTTVAPITSIAAAVAGDKARIDGLVPEGTNSHTFEPPPSAAKVLSRADIVFVNGLKLEEPTKELAETNLKKGAKIVEIGTTVLPESDYIYDFSFPKEDGKPNPHLWTDPTYAIKYAAVIRDTLVQADAANAEAYQANYALFEAKAKELDAALRADQETIPGGHKELLTYHDAYAYFAKTYGWKVIGAIQPQNFEDPTPKEIAALINQIKSEQVPVIFGSEVFPSKVLAEIGRSTGARYEDTLRDDDLPGKPGETEHSWLGLMRYDYVTMIKGLGGDPAKLQALDISIATPDKADYPQ